MSCYENKTHVLLQCRNAHFRNILYSISIKASKKILSGCPGMLWSLPLWRYSRPTWTRSYAACCRRPCFDREGWTRWPTEVPSNPYHSVILWFSLLLALL